MRIRIDLKIFILLPMMILITNQYTYLLAYFFIILHELGHMLIGMLLKLKPKSIELMLFGVSMEFFSADTNLIKQKEIIVAIAGPAVNLCLALVSIFFPMQDIFYINIVLCVFNLIPIYPLDGGRIVKAILHIFFGFKMAIKLSYMISNIIMVILSVFTMLLNNPYLYVFLVYLWYMRILEIKKYRIKKRIYKNIAHME